MNAATGARPENANVFPDVDPNSFQWDDDRQVQAMVRRVVDGTHPGVLTTIDENGQPQARWMASLSFDDIPWLYTLTAQDSRKVAQIEKHPEVGWMFCNADLSLVVHMTGKAKIFKDIETVKKIWALIRCKDQAYFLKSGATGLGISVVATRIERIECNMPKALRRIAVAVEKLKAEE